MAIEIAVIDVHAGNEEKFIQAVNRNLAAVTGAPGARSAVLLRCVEEPSRFVLQVDWESVAAHDAFRGSAEFAAWRADVGPHLAAPPAAAHYCAV